MGSVIFMSSGIGISNESPEDIADIATALQTAKDYADAGDVTVTAAAAADATAKAAAAVAARVQAFPFSLPLGGFDGAGALVPPTAPLPVVPTGKKLTILGPLHLTGNNTVASAADTLTVKVGLGSQGTAGNVAFTMTADLTGAGAISATSDAAPAHAGKNVFAAGVAPTVSVAGAGGAGLWVIPDLVIHGWYQMENA